MMGVDAMNATNAMNGDRVLIASQHAGPINSEIRIYKGREARTSNPRSKTIPYATDGRDVRTTIQIKERRNLLDDDAPVKPNGSLSPVVNKGVR